MFGEELCIVGGQGSSVFQEALFSLYSVDERRAFDVNLQAVLVRNFSFELPHGPGTGLDRHRSFLACPKVAGEEGPSMPLVIRRVG